MSVKVYRPANHGSGKSSEPKPSTKTQSKSEDPHRSQKVVNVMKTDA